MNDVQLTIPKIKVHEISIENLDVPAVTIHLGLMNHTGRCISRVRLDSNVPYVKSNIYLTDQTREAVENLIKIVEREYINEQIIQNTEDKKNA